MGMSKPNLEILCLNLVLWREDLEISININLVTHLMIEDRRIICLEYCVVA